MSRLPLILCVIALLGAGASATLYLQIGNSKRALQSELDTTRTRATSLEARLAATAHDKDVLEQRLVAQDADLGRAKTRLTASEIHNAQLTRDLADAKSALASRDETDLTLRNQVESLKRDLADAREHVVSPAAVAAYKNTIAELERQLADARAGNAIPAVAGASTAVFSAPATRPTAPAEAPPPPPMPTVLSVGPSNAFVVLNYGARRGAQTGQSLTIQRSGAAIASVSISDVRPNFCIAQVQPDSLHGALQKGDSAVLTN